MTEPTTLLRMPDVVARVGLCRATIYNRMKAGTFPAPVQIGERAVAWDASAIAEWQAGLKKGVKKSLV